MYLDGVFKLKGPWKSLDKSGSNDEPFEIDEEELEEERLDAAAKKIQALFRVRHAIHIVRIFAPLGECGPGLLSESSLPPQFALVITNRVFDSPKIPDIPSQVEGDHDALREVLEHPCFCKFLPENCFFFKNAIFEVFVAALASFSRQSGGVERSKKDSQDTVTNKNMAEDEKVEEFNPQEASLFVYVCTHSAEITKGKGIVGSYLVASDTSWKSKDQLARTAVPLKTFAEAIGRIQVRHKIVFFDVVHTAREWRGFKTRHLYPSRELYDNAARLSGAVVIGSCRIGGTREVNLEILRKTTETVWAIEDPTNGGSGSHAGRRISTGDNAGGSNNVSSELCDDDRAGSTDVDASWNGNGSNRGSTNEVFGSRRTNGRGARVHQPEDSDRQRGFECDRFSNDGKLRGSSASRKNPRIVIAVMDDDDTKDNARGCDRRQRLFGVTLKNVAGGREVSLCQDDAMRVCEPVYDRAVYGKEKSVFGRAVRDALGGECIVNSGTASRVLVVHLYNFIVQRLDSFERLSPKRTESKEWLVDGPNQLAGFRKKKVAAEVIPKQASWWWRSITRSAAQVGHEIYPTGELRMTQTPYAVEVSRDYVRLAWDNNADFAGAPPISYQLEQRGSLRNNGTWEPVFPPWYPAVVSQTVKVPHRVPGFGLQYRVRARNFGGWGAFSNPTITIVTKPWLANREGGKSTSRAMRALARTGGARLVLERMRRYSSSLLVQESGFHELIAEFNKGGGITRASLARVVVIVVSDAMKTFSQVRKIQASGLLLLGWAARGLGGGGLISQDTVERSLELVAAAEKFHSMDATVKGNALWTRSNLNSVRAKTAPLRFASSKGSGARTSTLAEERGTCIEDTKH